MRQTPLKVGVVGVGHLGRHHARLYAAAPEAQLVGVVDSDAERARAIAGEYGCEVFGKTSELAGKIEAASVAVPTAAHRVIAEELLEAGVDVLIEKPLARTLVEADAINATALRMDRLVMVGHTERFNPAVLALSRVVKEPRFFEMHRLAAFSARSTDIDVVLDLMIHDLDLLLHLDRTEAVSVEAAGIAALTDKVDIANARITMASGCIANITASRISAQQLRRVRVFQERTYLSCDTGKLSVERHRLDPDCGGTPRIERDMLPIEPGEPLANELSAFLGAVSSRSRPPVDGSAGRSVLELAHRVLESIERQRVLT